MSCEHSYDLAVSPEQSYELWALLWPRCVTWALLWAVSTLMASLCHLSTLAYKLCTLLRPLVNEYTLLPMMFLGLRKLRNICWDTKCFWTKSETFLVSRTQNLCPQQVLRVRANGETFVSATMCPQQCVLVCRAFMTPLCHLSTLMSCEHSYDLTVSPEHSYDHHGRISKLKELALINNNENIPPKLATNPGIFH